ncbi:MAG: MFS transporter [Candidatus Zixiibacteriota bacterium]|nr:MAG: MFS transporter [candidate division Zixibacteria bacterium]
MSTDRSADSSIWRRDVVGWSLYDFANTIYSMNIVSLYLKRYIVEDLGHEDYYFDVAFSVSMLLAAVLLPALGAMSDHATRKKLFLFLFTFTCCLSVGILPLVPPGLIFVGLALFIVANFAYEAGQPFYNTLLYSVASGRQARLISGFGVAWGYVGSILGMVFVLPFVTGEVFGWNTPFLNGSGKVGSFLPSAVLFMLFSLPLFFWVREKPVVSEKKMTFSKAYRDVWDGIRQTRKYPGVLRYLIADYFFEDAVTTVILNIGIYCSIVVGFAEGQITLFLIISTVSAVIGSFAMGWLAKIWRLKTLMMLIVYGWIGSLVIFVVSSDRYVVWVMGSIVGILLGGLWTTSRPMLAELVPRESLGRFFGLFSLSGRAAAFIGPLIWTGVVVLFQPDSSLGQATIEFLGMSDDTAAGLPYKAGILSLAAIMVIGLIIFRKVPHSRKTGNG